MFWLLSLLFLSCLQVFGQTTITGMQVRNPLPPVAALPLTCTPYSVYFLTTSNTPYVCTAPNTFTALATGSGGPSAWPTPSGTPGFLLTNGTTVSWGNLMTGGTGALDCVSRPGQCDVTNIVPLKSSANTWTGANDFHSALVRLPSTPAAGLPPASGNTGREFLVTDGANNCDYTLGGGSYQVLVKVKEDGSGYVVPNCGVNPPNPTMLSVVTALGDSLTRGYGWGASLNSNSYPSVLRTNTGLNVINVSVGGEDSGQILSWVAGLPTAEKAGFWVIWAGRNDFNGGANWVGTAASNSATTTANITSIVSAITAGGGDYVVMSILNACQNQEYPGGTNATSYTNILAENATLSSTYGSRYLDVRSMLVAIDNGAAGGTGFPALSGGHDCPGATLEGTGVHLNDTGYADVAGFVQTKIQAAYGSWSPNISGINKAAQLQAANPVITASVAVTISTTIALTTYPPVDVIDGHMYCFNSSASNVGAVTISFNGLPFEGNVTAVKQGGAALVSGDITTTIEPCFVYHLYGASNDQFELLNPQTASSGGGSGGGGGVASFNTRTGSVALTAADVNGVGTITNNTSGNAAALAVNPTTCSSGQSPTGILANGNATGCQSVGGGSGGGGGPAVYSQNGTALSGAKIVYLSGMMTAGITTFTMTGPAVFSSQPICTAALGMASSGPAPYVTPIYCTQVGTACSAASTGSSIVFTAYTGGNNADAGQPFTAICVGN